MVNYEAAAAITGLVSFVIFVLAAANYVSACEDCHVLAKKCRSYERHMKSRNNPSIDEMASMTGVVRQAYGQYKHKRFMRSVYFVAQVLAGMAVLGVLIYLVVRAV